MDANPNRLRNLAGEPYAVARGWGPARGESVTASPALIANIL